MNKIWISIGVFCCIVLALCFAYPYLFSLYIDYYCAKQLPKYDPATNGTFGDMFGGLNTVFSGLAFVGLIATIAVQINIHKREIERENLKREEEAREAKVKHDKFINDKLKYLLSLFKKVVESNKIFINDVTRWIDNNSEDKVELTMFTSSPTDNVLKLVSQKINQEEFYHSYREKNQNDEVLDTFEKIESTLILRNQIENWRDTLIKDINTKSEEIWEKHFSIHKMVQSIKINEVELLYNKYIIKNSNEFNIDTMGESYIGFLDKILLLKITTENNDLYSKIEDLTTTYQALVAQTNDVKNLIANSKEGVLNENNKILFFLNAFEDSL